jgi:hypothetical protein
MKYSRIKILNSLARIWYSGIKGVVFAVIGLVLYSCSSLRSIEIEVAVLPEYPIADNIQSLALMNRSMDLQFSNIKPDSLEKMLINKKMVIDTVFQDSLAADTAIQVAAKALFESGRFDAVVPKARNIDRLTNDDISNPLTHTYISTICKDFNVDAVLVLESFNEHLATTYRVTQDGVNYFKVYEAATDITYQSEWRLYRPDELKPSVRFYVTDSIFWKDESSFLKDLYEKMPLTKEALIGGGIASGLKMAGYISTNWVSQSRMYFLTGKPEIDAAVPLIKENKWAEAADLWAKYAKTNSRRTRGKVEFNLALAAEMNGDLDQAIEWGLKSFKTSYSKATEEYLKILDTNRKAKQKERKLRY